MTTSPSRGTCTRRCSPGRATSPIGRKATRRTSRAFSRGSGPRCRSPWSSATISAMERPTTSTSSCRPTSPTRSRSPHGFRARLERSLSFLHVPATKHRNADAHYAPLAALRLPEGYKLFLGLIHHDDRDGDRRRIAVAAKDVSDFGIASEWGWGRGYPSCAPRPPRQTPHRARSLMTRANGRPTQTV